MAGIETAFALDDHDLKALLSTPDLLTPQVYKAFFAVRVDRGGIHKERVRGASFWKEMDKKHGLSRTEIIASNNALVDDMSVMLGLQPKEWSAVSTINSEGSDLKRDQIVVFKGG